MHLRFWNVVAAFGLLLVPAVITLAGNDVLIVPQELEDFQIDEQDLLINDGGGAEIVSFSSTSRGTLKSVPAGSFIYSPGEDFSSMGMDFFSYVSDDLTGEPKIVFLVYAPPPLSAPFVNAMDLEVAREEFILRSGVLAADGLFEEPLLSPDSLNTTLTGSFGDKPGEDEGPKIETDLDPSAFMLGEQGDQVTVARVGNLELILIQDQGDLVMSAQDAASGELLASAVLLPGAQSIAATWWTSLEEGIGTGLALQIGDRLVASATDVAQFIPTSPIEARFGLMNPIGVTSGHLLMNGLTSWSAAPSVLLPIFADGVESGGLEIWSSRDGLIEVTPAAAIHGAMGLEIPGPFPAYVADDSPGGVARYRARFSLDPRLLAWPEGARVTLLKAIDAQGASPFTVALQQSGGFEICAEAWSSGGLVALPCRALDVATAYMVEVRWWAASDTGVEDGGLRFWIDEDPSTPDKELLGEVLNLINGAQAITEIRLGAMDPDGMASGPLFLDDFETWH